MFRSRQLRSQQRPAGFTLVELLVVILVIGILVALLIPAVNSVMSAAQRTRIGLDIANLAQAIEQYKNKYSDYPPDFSDVPFKPWNQTVVYRHARKAFPRITTAELTNLQAFYTRHPITPAEALVFWLGGMSDNPTQPFTGQGGPLVPTGNAQEPFVWRIQERSKPIYAFPENRLVVSPNDQDQNGNVFGVVFMPNNRQAPFVYFDSRTYGFIDAQNEPRYGYLEWPVPDNPSSYTIARPYKSDTPNTTFNPNSGQDQILLDRVLHWVNRDTFQIVSGGLDDMYGQEAPPVLAYDDPRGNPVPLLTRFPSGRGFHPATWPWNGNANTNANPSLNDYFVNQADNLGNFSEGQSLEQAQ